MVSEGGLDRFFPGAWSDVKKTETSPPEPPQGQPAVVQKAPAKSKFATFFAPREEPASHSGQHAAPEVSKSPPAGSDEDREGFQMIMAKLLNSNKVNSPSPSQTSGNMPPPPKPQAERQNRPTPDNPDRSYDFEFNQTSRRGNSTRTPVNRTPADERKNPFESPNMPQSANNDQRARQYLASLPGLQAEQMRNHSPPKRTPESAYRNEMLTSNDLNREMLNRSAAQQRGLDSKSEFLLNLMQQPHLATPSQHTLPHRPPPQPQQPSYNTFFDEEPKAPKPQKLQGRGLPPGLFNEASLYELDQGRDLGRPEVTRKQSHRAPPGLYDDPAIASIQRRNTGEAASRHHMSNMGIPQHPGPDQFMMKATSGMQHQDRIAPPPGFNGPTAGRPGPPGFGPPGMPLHSGNHQLPHPGMQRGMAGGPPGLFQGGMQGPPPGFFRDQAGPPGFGPGPGQPSLAQESMLGLEQMSPHPNQMPRHFDPFAGMPQGRPGGRGVPPGYGL